MNNFNGRVNILQPNTNTLFNMHDKIPSKQITDYRNPNTPVKINYPFDILDYRGKVIVYNLKESR